MTPIVELVEYLMPEHIIVPQGDIVGFTYNKKKKELRFITEKEAKKLTRKQIAWWKIDDWQRFKEIIKGEENKNKVLSRDKKVQEINKLF